MFLLLKYQNNTKHKAGTRKKTMIITMYHVPCNISKITESPERAHHFIINVDEKSSPSLFLLPQHTPTNLQRAACLSFIKDGLVFNNFILIFTWYSSNFLEAWGMGKFYFSIGNFLKYRIAHGWQCSPYSQKYTHSLIFCNGKVKKLKWELEEGNAWIFFLMPPSPIDFSFWGNGFYFIFLHFFLYLTKSVTLFSIHVRTLNSFLILGNDLQSSAERHIIIMNRFILKSFNLSSFQVPYSLLSVSSFHWERKKSYFFQIRVFINFSFYIFFLYFPPLVEPFPPSPLPLCIVSSPPFSCFQLAIVAPTGVAWLLVNWRRRRKKKGRVNI